MVIVNRAYYRPQTDPRVPPPEDLLQLEDGTWEGQIQWNGDRSKIAVTLEADESGPSGTYREACYGILTRLGAIEKEAREALGNLCTSRSNAVENVI
jgi:hypothetical protein